jgi:hypothetical protein
MTLIKMGIPLFQDYVDDQMSIACVRERLKANNCDTTAEAQNILRWLQRTKKLFAERIAVSEELAHVTAVAVVDMEGRRIFKDAKDASLRTLNEPLALEASLEVSAK